jgi:redox-sensitive bicupin YhaK (pirin superfamily)
MSDAILRMTPLGFQWPMRDPFLFCAHHSDAYPRGNDRMGPDASLAGRDLGMDFGGKDGWSMYHGEEVPGFPAHPHRGFETVTIVRRGLIDHSDSLGAAARYGHGDVQWLTAGRGIQHSEMFPLVDRDHPNPGELFQIWLNLPAADKLVDPNFSMFWNEAIPRVGGAAAQERGDAAHRYGTSGFAVAGAGVEVTVIAGALGDVRPLAPPPHSWAARPDSDVAIWAIELAPGATWTVPPAKPGTNRTLYFFRGRGLGVAGTAVPASRGIEVRPDVALPLVAGPDETEVLVLQGRPIGEPVAQHGPFVMNRPAEIQQAFVDYQRTRFGGWPWDSDAPVHPRNEGRFARYTDGRVERAPAHA